MAHYKRRKCRRNAPRAIRGSINSWRAKVGLKPIRIDEARNLPFEQQWHAYLSPMNGHPAWWDRNFHTKPRRAKEKRLLRNVQIGKVDPDNVAWPLLKKPHIYYW